MVNLVELYEGGKWLRSGADRRPSNAKLKSVALFQGSREPLKIYEEKNDTQFQ